jgi:predicted small lipoprotein YifL
MTARVRLLSLASILAAAAAGCGQQGPLVLPEDARPIERVDPQDAPGEPEPAADEDTDER